MGVSDLSLTLMAGHGMEWERRGVSLPPLLPASRDEAEGEDTATIELSSSVRYAEFNSGCWPQKVSYMWMCSHDLGDLLCLTPVQDQKLLKTW